MRLFTLLLFGVASATAATGCRPDAASKRVSAALQMQMNGPGGLLAEQPRAGVVSPPPPENGAVLLAPALPLDYSIELKPYLTDLIDNFSVRRWERHIAADEPSEGVLDVYPAPNATRARVANDVTELHFRVGEELFETELSVLPGFGDGMDGNKPPNMHRVHHGAHGGPDTSSCRSCHHRSGDDGAGEYTEAALTSGDGINPASAAERNPPALHGGGALQILAREITNQLGKLVNNRTVNQITDVPLIVDGVDFGKVRLFPDGRIDTSKLTAIDPDLMVRPFGWKGTHSTLRRFAEEAFQVHHGLQSSALILQRRLYGPLLHGTSPATRALSAVLGAAGEDPDGDHMVRELVGSQLTAMAVYLTLLPLPVIEPPRSRELFAAFREGMATFSEVGCASCHKPMWQIKDPTWVERGEDETSAISIKLDLRKDIRNGPQMRTINIEMDGYPIYPFTDMRRHDMGPELADHAPPAKDATSDHVGPSIPPSYFFTRPLWGLSDSPPYLHDGRAATIHEAILGHGGEAAPTRENYKRLPKERQRALQVFLFSLARPTLPEVTP